MADVEGSLLVVDDVVVDVDDVVLADEDILKL